MFKKIAGVLLAFGMLLGVGVSLATAASASTLGQVNPSGSQVYNECGSQGYITVRDVPPVSGGGASQLNLGHCGWAGGDAGYTSWYFDQVWLTPGWCISYSWLGGPYSYTLNGNGGPASWRTLGVQGKQTKIFLYGC